MGILFLMITTFPQFNSTNTLQYSIGYKYGIIYKFSRHGPRPWFPGGLAMFVLCHTIIFPNIANYGSEEEEKNRGEIFLLNGTYMDPLRHIFNRTLWQSADGTAL